MSLVSVVIPSYNDADMLRRCLAALATQTRPADEIIVVDNASTDDTAAVALAAGARVVTEPVRGIFPATAAGFDAAHGDLLARLDADSVPPHDWLERIHAAFDADVRLDAISGPGRFYGSTRVIHWIAEHCYVGAYRVFVSPMLGHDVLYGSNLTLRSDTWREVRPRVHRWMPDVHDDLDVTMNLAPGTVVRFDRSLVVGVSARPFATVGGLAHRLRVAFHTLSLNFREESLLSRRRAWRHAERSAAPQPDASAAS